MVKAKIFDVIGAVGPGEALGASIQSCSGAYSLPALCLPTGAQAAASDVLRYLFEFYTAFVSGGCLCNYRYCLTGEEEGWVGWECPIL